MAFNINNWVEICKKEKGLSSIYYSATLSAAVGRSRYLVRYETRLIPDGTRFLTEVVDADEVRPLSPDSSYFDFMVSQRVDAFMDKAWRVGTVTRKVDPNYYVKLDCNGNEVHCPSFKSDKSAAPGGDPGN
ncbi:RNA binding-like protein [Hibiscus syriacus]|uniref:RNA binding-like protein n=1 Tax=Hibiscus syriacus TaxID=106335 RepID=A0A6A2WQ79_HIBSY|nr:RNA binding-like protein [Hibiscus syriacus]